MTCTNIILAKPEAGSSVPYALPEGESAQLSFGPGEIAGLAMNADGALVIRFVEGGELTLTNFQSMVDGGNLLYLSDGTLVDPAVLQASLASGIAPAAGADTIVVGIPADGVTKEYMIETGKNYVLDFDIDVPVSTSRQNGSFVMTFENGSRVILNNYDVAMASADAPTITSSSEVCVYEGEELITNIQALAETIPAEKVIEEEVATAPKKAAQGEDVANIEPASGEEVANIEPAAGGAERANSGYGFNSTATAAPLGSLDDVGPIDPTLLSYGADFQQYEQRLPVKIDTIPTLTAAPTATLDETNLDTGYLGANGKIIVDFGNDGIGSITPNGSFGAGGSLDNGVLSSGGVPVSVTQTVNGYEGYAGGTLVFTFTINPVTGDYSYSQHKAFDHADANDANDLIRLQFGIAARDADGDEATTSIRIDILDDAPEIASTGKSVDETDLSAGPVTVGGAVMYTLGSDTNATGFGATGSFAASGSQLGGTLTTAGGSPVTVGFNATTGTYTGTATVGGTVVTIFTMTVQNDGSYSFTLLRPLDHADKNDPNDIIHLDFGVAATDYDGDKAATIIRIDVKDDVPTISNSSGDVDESNFDAGNLVYSDTVDHSFGAELGSIGATGTTSSSIPLTSNGVAVAISQSGNTYTGKAGGVTIFTLTIDAATGKYTYTQVANLDHPSIDSDNESLSINFGVLIKSVDGTTDTGTITINVADDGVSALDDVTSAEERQLITGDVTANDDLSTDDANTVTNILFNGVNHAVPAGGSVTISTSIGTLVMHSTGKYSYTAVNGHPDGTDVFTYTLKDSDGDSDTAKLSVRVTPDGTPVTANDALGIDETALSSGSNELNGNLNVDFGVDGRGSGGVSGSGQFASGGSRENGILSSNGKPITVSMAGDTYTGTANGVVVFTLKVNGDGTYKFTLLDTLDHDNDTDPNDIINLNFGVTIVDADGDTAGGNILVRVYDDAPVAIDDAPVTIKGDVTVTGDITSNDSHSMDGPNNVIAVNGVNIPANGANVTIVGTYGTLVINNTGAYSYTPKSALQIGVDEFNYTLQDSDGDRDTATFSFNVLADYTPVITQVGGAEVLDETALSGGIITETGSLAVNYGGDTPSEQDINGTGTFSFNGSALNGALTHNGVAVNVTYNAATDTYTGKAGALDIFTLKIDQNGAYTFKLMENLDHADGSNANDAINLVFGVSAKDADGDIGKGTMTIVVRDDAPTAVNVTGSTEERLLNTGTQSVSGSVASSFGQDGGAVSNAVVGNGTFSATGEVSGGALTHKGTAVVVSYNASTGTYVGMAGTLKVFDLVLSNNGAYKFNLYDTLDHGDRTRPDEIITLNFGVKVTDYDGDSANGIIHINVADDGPRIITTSGAARTADLAPTPMVDESGLGQAPQTFGGTVNVDFGNDGPAAVDPFIGNGIFKATGSVAGGTLTSEGVAVVVTHADGVYTGKAGDRTVFTFSIDDDGHYVFTLKDTLDHANGADANDAILLDFGIRVTDEDGDVANTNVVIEVRDDAPLAVADVRSVDEGSIATGNVMTNDTASQDGSTTVTSVKFGTQTITVPAAGSVTIVGTYGTLSINANGNYTYLAKVGANGVDKFSYTLTDGDGDTSTTTLTITTVDTIVPIVTNGTASVDETDLSDGTITQTGSVSVNYGGDGPGTLSASGSFSSTGSKMAEKLSHNGTLITVTQANGVYTGKAGSVTVFTMTIKADGSYEFKQFEQIDHADAANPNDSINLVFGVTATDIDGSKASGTVTVTVADDAPKATNDNGGTTSGTNPKLTGNVMTNDIAGQDGAVIVTQVKFGSQTINVPATGTVSVVGTYGTLVIAKDGSYTYTAKDKANGSDVFSYTIKDFDGDTSTATLTVAAKDGVPDITDNGSGSTDGIVTIDETNLANGAIIQTGKVTVDFGSDGAGSVAGNGAFSSNGSQTGGKLAHNGTAVTVTFANGVYTGKAGSVTVFTMAIKADGSYEFKQFEQLDHANGADANDAINLVFGITASDKDGDTDTDTITVRVLDDAPTAKADNGGTTSGTNTKLTGNVMTNDLAGQDGSVVTQVKFGSQTVNVPATGTISVVGTYGTLVIAKDGTYTYTAKDKANGTDVFSYTIKDFDGDTSTTTLTVAAKDGVPDIKDNGSGSTDGIVTIDETSLTTGTIVQTGKVTVDYGSDGAGSVAGSGTFSSNGSQTGGKLAHNGTAVTVTFANGVYTGKAGSVTVFTMAIKSDGSYEFKQFEQLDHANGADANDAINLVFGITASDKDGDKDAGVITVRVLDDAPIAKADNGGTTSGTNPKLTGNVMTNDIKGQDGSVIITQVKVGNEVIKVPTTGSLTVIGTYGVLSISSDGAYTYVAKNGANGVDVFSYTIKDFDGDTSTTTLTVTAKDGIPVAVNDVNSVDEGKSVSANVTANDTAGSDGPATVVAIKFGTLNYSVPATGSLTVKGEFGTLVIDKTGAYTYTANNGTNGKDVFTYTYADKDGDTDTATLTITSNDTGVPVIVDAATTVDETALIDGGTITQTGKVTVGYGADSTGTVAGNGVFSSSGSQTGGKLAHNGTAVTVSFANGVYTGKAGSVTIFTMTVKADGTYTFKQFEQLDHADGNNANDAINLVFGVKATDREGDSDAGTITVKVLDDAPIAKADAGGTATGVNTKLTGNVLTNDVKGQDGTVIVTQVKFGNQTVNVPATGTISVVGTHGTLVIAKDGSYTYTAKNGATGTDVFSYTIKDFDGDTSTTTLTVAAKDGAPEIAANGSGSVDETDKALNSEGYVGTGGKLEVNYGSDGAGKVAGNGSFSANGSMLGGSLKFHGKAVVVTYDAATSTYTGAAGTVTVFKLKINTDGSYSFGLYETLDHADAKNANDAINLVFGVTASDKDGDTDTASITIKVLDDAPTAKSDNGGTTSGVNPKLTGNVTSNDVKGADEGVSVTTVKFGTKSYTVPPTGTVTIKGEFGVLVISKSGAYTYTANNGANGTDKFSYTIKDYDGDTSSATLTVAAKDGAPDVTANGVSTVDETNKGLNSEGYVGVGGKVTVDFGSDGAGKVAGSGSFSANGSLAGGALKFHGTPVAVTYDTATGTYTGKAGSVVVFTLKINTDGTYSFGLRETLDHADGANPNDAINLVFGVVASDKDGDKDLGTITIKVLDDGVVANDDNGGATSGTNPKLTGNVMTNDDRSEDDGVAVTSVKFGTKTYDIPTSGTLTIKGEYGTLVISKSGAYTYTAVNGANGTDKFTYTIKDFDGDSDSAVLTVVAKDGAPIAANDTAKVDEGKSVTGNVMTNDKASTDTPTTVTEVKFGTKTYAVPTSGSLTIKGEYGTLVISKTGAYTYTAVTGKNGTDLFTYTITDKDGDEDTATLTITASDVNVPTVVNALETIDETSLSGGTITETGKVSVNYNGDGPGKVAANGSFSSSGSQAGGKLTYLDTPVTVTLANGVYTGKAGSTTVFTMTIAADGSYTFKLYQQLDHADGNNDNDVINLNFGITATDVDGDKTNGRVTISVKDDIAVAKDDNGGTTKGTDPKLTGNVLTNDTKGQDTTTYVTSVKFDGKTYAVPASGNATIVGDHGTLVINKSGTYTYTAKNKENGTDKFTYVITDGDGDTDDAVLSVTAKDGVPDARDDSNAVGTNWNARATGNVLSNDAKGSDGGVVVTNPGTYQGNFGTLTLKADGSYTYVRTAGQNAGGTENFRYGIKDADGDTDTATLRINVQREWNTGGDGGDGRGDPLILDLNGDGINLISKENGVSFDLDNDGIADKTAWVAKDDAFLALDRNKDGEINGVNELFGDTDGHDDGFQHLGSYDENGDKIIDAKDSVWADLIIWQDLNQDGKSDANEMLTLEQVGIVGLRLTTTQPENLYIEGNWISHVSSYIMADGTEREIVDAWLEMDKGFHEVAIGTQDAVYGDDGADSFLFAAIGEAATTVYNFDAEGGDRLDLSAVLHSQDDVTDAINDFVYARQDGDDMVISVDVTGSGNAANAVDIARLDGMTGIDLDSLLQNGNIVI